MILLSTSQNICELLWHGDTYLQCRELGGTEGEWGRTAALQPEWNLWRAKLADGEAQEGATVKCDAKLGRIIDIKKPICWLDVYIYCIMIQKHMTL